MKVASRESWFETATVCDCGLVRAENQDNFLSDPAAGCFVVADGMGGGQGGAKASQFVADAFRGALKPAEDLAARLETLRTTIDAANRTILDFARKAGYRQSGSTVAALLFGDELPGKALSVWVGDSRVYAIRAGKAAAMTNDHTVANELFGRGGSAGYSRTLPYAHVLTRVLGVDPRVAADARRFDVRPGDRFLVCSDGVHDMLPPERIGEIVSSAPTAEAATKALAEAIRAAGAVDNYTATVVFAKEPKK